MTALLSVQDISIGFGTGDPVVKDVSFDVEAGQTLALVGESGSGKTISCRAALRILPRAAQIRSGSITLNDAKGRDVLTEISERQMRDIRGNRISMIFQEPMAVSVAPAQDRKSGQRSPVAAPRGFRGAGPQGSSDPVRTGRFSRSGARL